jgi:hypothetical protein
MLRPFASLCKSLLVCRCEGFFVNRCVCNRTRYGIKQALQHPDSRRHLAGRQLFDQFVRVLFICRHNTAILHRDVRRFYRCISRRFRAYDKPMAKAKKFELESSAPILNQEDEQTFAAIDEGILSG